MRTVHLTGVLLLFLTCCGDVGYSQKTEPLLDQQINLGFEKPGVGLFSIFTHLGDPMDAFTRIGLQQNNRTYVLRDLKDLRGKVSLPDKSAALRFVRLRTSPYTYLLWNKRILEAEVVEASSAPELPDFGLEDDTLSAWVRDFGGLKSGAELTRSDWSKVKSGTFGILSDQAYQKGNFQPPDIILRHNRYQITRWLYVLRTDLTHDAEESIQQVREEVGKDGTYKRSVIKKLKPPILPNTTWGLRLPITE